MEIKACAEFGIGSVETIEMFSLTSKSPIFSFEKTSIEFVPNKVYDLPKSHNCRNCGAPVYGYKCEYCSTRY